MLAYLLRALSLPLLWAQCGCSLTHDLDRTLGDAGGDAKEAAPTPCEPGNCASCVDCQSFCQCSAAPQLVEQCIEQCLLATGDAGG